MDLASRVAGWANDGEQIEAYASRSSSSSVRVYNAEVEALQTADTEGIGIRVVVGDRQGISYATVLDEGTLKQTLEEARDNAAFGSPDPHAGLAEPDGVAVTPVELWRDELAELPADRKLELALELERRVLAADSRIKTVTNASWADSSSEAALATSTGIAVSSRRTGCSLSVGCLAGDDIESQTGFGYSIGRSQADLDTDKVVSDAVARATRMLGAKKPKSAGLTVLLDPMVTSSFLGILAGTLSGESVLKGRSLFANRVGEQVGGSIITLVDDPTDPEAYGASEYDAEGLACRRNVLIDAGTLGGYLYNTHAARMAGASSTGSAVRGGFGSAPGIGARALSLVPGDRTQEELITSIDDGLLVQSVSGLHSGVNPVSGDFSVGAEGVRIRGGALAEPVRELTIASTIQRMLLDALAVGSDLEWLPSSAAGVSLVIADISMGGA